MKVVLHHSLAELVKLQREEKAAFRSRNLQIIVLAMQSWTAPAIGIALGLSRRVVQSRVEAYNASGLEALGERRGAPPKRPLDEEQQAAFAQRVEQGAQPADVVCSLRGRDFQRILNEEFGCLRSLTTVYRILHDSGYSYLRPRPKHHRCDPAKRESFLNDLPSRIAQIATAHPNKKLRIFFQDESRFGQQGTLTNIWAKRGSRPEIKRQTEFKYVWVLGVVCPETGASEGLICPYLNTKSVNVFLEHFSRSLAPDEHAVMLWDGAGFHRSGKLRMPENITPITLPPYSPDLNPIENLWHYLKSHYWSNRTYRDHEELEKAVIQAWKDSVDKNELIKTVCSAKIYERAGIG